MPLTTITNQAQWESFVRSAALDSGLLHSWQWGEAQKSLGQQIKRLALINEQKEIQALALVVVRSLPFGFTYWYLPRGPVGKTENCLQLLDQLATEAKVAGALFIRFDPAWDDSATLTQKGYKHVGQVNPAQTLIIDLSRSTEQLLADMKPKARYNIKVAQKHGITIDRGDQYFADFWRLIGQTAERNQITNHSEAHYRALLTTSVGALEIIVARDGERVIAANMIAHYNGQMIYLHGGSDDNFKNKMAPYLLQWETMRYARELGCQSYDLWGADEEKWPGVTRFKRGLAPEVGYTRYVGAWDRPVNQWLYRLYRLIRKANF